MVVDDLYIGGAFCRPDEADAPLLVDADAVLSLSVVPQGLQAVAGRGLQVIKNCRPVELRQLAQRGSLNVHPAFDALALIEGLGVFALEALDSHGSQQ